MLHVLGVIIIRLLCPNAYPKEVLGLLAFIDDLLAVGSVKHGVQDIFGQLGLVWVRRPAHPRIYDALVVFALKGNLENEAELKLRRPESVLIWMHRVQRALPLVRIW